MNFQDINPDESISLFVKNIWVFNGFDNGVTTRLPFFADGYPGLMFHKSDNGLTVHPHNKTMPELFLYGQTIKPIELQILGAYSLIIFRLYPFVVKSFFEVVPQAINDDCYYLNDTMGLNIHSFTSQLLSYESVSQKVDAITELLLLLFEKKKQCLDFTIKQAIEKITQSKGQESIHQIANQLNINIRTFERRFLNETGLAPKQFAKIVQFQSSFHQLTTKDFSKLTDVVYQNGYSDQSHFIKVFKAYTGKTPKKFKV